MNKAIWITWLKIYFFLQARLLDVNSEAGKFVDENLLWVIHVLTDSYSIVVDVLALLVVAGLPLVVAEEADLDHAQGKNLSLLTYPTCVNNIEHLY